LKASRTAVFLDGDHGVHHSVQLIEALLCVPHAHPALEEEGLGDDAHGEGSRLPGHLGQHRRRARAGAAAEPGRHEHHVGALEQLVNPLAHLERRAAPLVGIGAAAEAARDLAAELDLVRRELVLERLRVGVRRDELHPLEARLDHVVERVAAASAHADHLDRGPLVRCVLKLEHLPAAVFAGAQEISVFLLGSRSFGAGSGSLGHLSPPRARSHPREI
jgi:hypothetical protein